MFLIDDKPYSLCGEVRTDGILRDLSNRSILTSSLPLSAIFLSIEFRYSTPEIQRTDQVLNNRFIDRSKEK